MPRTTRERLTPWLFMGEGNGQLKAEDRETLCRTRDFPWSRLLQLRSIIAEDPESNFCLKYEQRLLLTELQ